MRTRRRHRPAWLPAPELTSAAGQAYQYGLAKTDGVSQDPDSPCERTSSGRRRNGRDSGVATVYACLGCVLLLVVTGLAVQLGAGVLARQRAETAADLSALAGAANVLQGPDIACAAAVAVASANDAAAESCSVSGPEVRVTVTVLVNAGPLIGSAAGRARAGPVSAAAGPAPSEQTGG